MITTSFSQLPDMLTMQQVQEALQIGRNTAYALVKSGELKAIKLRNCIRVPKSSLEELTKMCYNNIGVNSGYSLKEA